MQTTSTQFYYCRNLQMGDFLADEHIILFAESHSIPGDPKKIERLIDHKTEVLTLIFDQIIRDS